MDSEDNLQEGDGGMSRKLDAKLAEALGYELDVSISKYGWYYMVTGEVCSVKTKSVVPLYSTDGNAMLELDREMRERGGGHGVSLLYE